MATEKRNIIIVGGGIIGCTTAYYITRHPFYNPAAHTITLIEATSIASAASGKAGGLLALWAYPSSIVPLSYKLHAQLAAEHNGAERWGYRTLHTGSITAKGRHLDNETDTAAPVEGNEEEWQKLPKLEGGRTANGKKTKNGIPSDLDWFDADAITSYSEMGTPSTTAQVHPFQFTTSIATLAAEAGVNIILGSVTSLDYSPTGVNGLTYSDKTTSQSHTLPATDIILAAGPWTSRVFPEAPIEAQRAHSVVIKADVSPYAIFSEIELPKGFGRKEGEDKKRRHGLSVSPEMYARPDGTVYACGEADTDIPLPANSSLVECSPTRCADITSYVSSISSPLRHGATLTQQACYLPSVTGGGGPLIGKTHTPGLFIAAGHTCWGIQNSCATGMLMSEFVFEGEAKSARIGDLDPRGFL